MHSSESFEGKAWNSGTRKGHLLPLLLFNIIMEVVAQAIRKPNEIKDIGIGKEKIKLSIFALFHCLKYPGDLQSMRHMSVNTSTNQLEM